MAKSLRKMVLCRSELWAVGSRSGTFEFKRLAEKPTGRSSLSCDHDQLVEAESEMVLLVRSSSFRMDRLVASDSDIASIDEFFMNGLVECLNRDGLLFKVSLSTH